MSGGAGPMTRRREPASGWSVKTVKSPLWKYVHPVKHLKNEARRARRQMAPAEVLGRVFSVPEIRSAVGTKTVHVNAETRRKQAAAAQKRAAAPAKKAAAKKTTGRPGSSVYEQAQAIPAQNRAAAAKMAQPRKKPAPMKDRVLRNPDGTLAGSTPAFSPADAATNTRAWQGHVDPALRPRNLRGRSQ